MTEGEWYAKDDPVRDQPLIFGGAQQADLLRDILGLYASVPESFMPPNAQPRSDLWGEAYGLGLQAYEDRLPAGLLDNERLAILADCLEDADGDDGHHVHPVVLRHLRTEAVHVRGCWALDLVLGKR